MVRRWNPALKEIMVVGLGPGGIEQLTGQVWQVLESDAEKHFRTAVHPVVEELKKRGIRFTSFDDLYEEKASFEEVYDEIVEKLITRARAAEEDKLIVYAVPGHPLVGERSVQMLLREGEKYGIKVTVVPGVSFIDTVLNVLCLDPTEGLLVIDALSFDSGDIITGHHIVFSQVYKRLVASDLKLVLLEMYPPEHPATVVRAAGVAGEEEVVETVLCELDHFELFDHLTSVYISPLRKKQHNMSGYPLDPLVEVLEKLLSPQGCPWDRQQTHFTLKECLLEETYEVIEAIDNEDMSELCEELGDVLLQVVFHSALAQERGDFDCNDVVRVVTEKMIRRHPHVFGSISVKDSGEVLKNWEIIKAEEKRENGKKQGEDRKSVLSNLNRALPALMLAEEVQKKAKKVGFDWEDAEGAWDKVFEEIDELKEACREKINMEEELGDLLFAVVNIARFIGVSSEAALIKTVHKFIRRFNYIENSLWEQNIKWEQTNLEMLDILWEKAKKTGL